MARSPHRNIGPIPASPCPMWRTNSRLQILASTAQISPQCRYTGLVGAARAARYVRSALFWETGTSLPPGRLPFKALPWTAILARPPCHSRTCTYVVPRSHACRLLGAMKVSSTTPLRPSAWQLLTADACPRAKQAWTAASNWDGRSRRVAVIGATVLPFE